jgi:hypothetical protein
MRRQVPASGGTTPVGVVSAESTLNITNIVTKFP